MSAAFVMRLQVAMTLGLPSAAQFLILPISSISREAMRESFAKSAGVMFFAVLGAVSVHEDTPSVLVWEP